MYSERDRLLIPPSHHQNYNGGYSHLVVLTNSQYPRPIFPIAARVRIFLPTIKNNLSPIDCPREKILVLLLEDTIPNHPKEYGG
jgi:hypothetical protein